jgi:hypothetical protein
MNLLRNFLSLSIAVKVFHRPLDIANGDGLKWSIVILKTSFPITKSILKIVAIV